MKGIKINFTAMPKPKEKIKDSTKEESLDKYFPEEFLKNYFDKDFAKT